MDDNLKTIAHKAKVFQGYVESFDTNTINTLVDYIIYIYNNGIEVPEGLEKANTVLTSKSVVYFLEERCFNNPSEELQEKCDDAGDSYEEIVDALEIRKEGEKFTWYNSATVIKAAKTARKYMNNNKSVKKEDNDDFLVQLVQFDDDKANEVDLSQNNGSMNSEDWEEEFEQDNKSEYEDTDETEEDKSEGEKREDETREVSEEIKNLASFCSTRAKALSKAMVGVKKPLIYSPVGSVWIETYRTYKVYEIFKSNNRLSEIGNVLGIEDGSALSEKDLWLENLSGEYSPMWMFDVFTNRYMSGGSYHFADSDEEFYKKYLKFLQETFSRLGEEYLNGCNIKGIFSRAVVCSKHDGDVIEIKVIGDDIANNIARASEENGWQLNISKDGIVYTLNLNLNNNELERILEDDYDSLLRSVTAEVIECLRTLYEGCYMMLLPEGTLSGEKNRYRNSSGTNVEGIPTYGRIKQRNSSGQAVLVNTRKSDHIDTTNARVIHDEIKNIFGVGKSKAGDPTLAGLDNEGIASAIFRDWQSEVMFGDFVAADGLEEFARSNGDLDGERNVTRWATMEGWLKTRVKKILLAELCRVYKNKDIEDIDNIDVNNKLTSLARVMTNASAVVDSKNEVYYTIRVCAIGSNVSPKALKDKAEGIRTMIHAQKVEVEKKESYVYEMKFIMNNKLYKQNDIFAHEALEILAKKGIRSSWKSLVLGKTPDGNIFMKNFQKNIDFTFALYGGTGSGKGVMTLNILATAIADGCPVMYLDNKPEVATFLAAEAWKEGRDTASWDGAPTEGYESLENYCGNKGLMQVNPRQKYPRAYDFNSIPSDLGESIRKSISYEATYLKGMEVFLKVAKYRKNHESETVGMKRLVCVADEMENFSNNVSKVLREAITPIITDKKSELVSAETKQYLFNYLDWSQSVVDMAFYYVKIDARKSNTTLFTVFQSNVYPTYKGTIKGSNGKVYSLYPMSAILGHLSSVNTKIMGWKTFGPPGTGDTTYGTANTLENKVSWYKPGKFEEGMFALGTNTINTNEAVTFRPFKIYGDISTKSSRGYMYDSIIASGLGFEAYEGRLIQKKAGAQGEDWDSYEAHPAVGFSGYMEKILEGTGKTAGSLLGDGFDYITGVMREITGDAGFDLNKYVFGRSDFKPNEEQPFVDENGKEILPDPEGGVGSTVGIAENPGMAVVEGRDETGSKPEDEDGALVAGREEETVGSSKVERIDGKKENKSKQVSMPEVADTSMDNIDPYDEDGGSAERVNGKSESAEEVSDSEAIPEIVKASKNKVASTSDGLNVIRSNGKGTQVASIPAGDTITVDPAVMKKRILGIESTDVRKFRKAKDMLWSTLLKNTTKQMAVDPTTMQISQDMLKLANKHISLSDFAALQYELHISDIVELEPIHRYYPTVKKLYIDQSVYDRLFNITNDNVEESVFAICKNVLLLGIQQSNGSFKEIRRKEFESNKAKALASSGVNELKTKAKNTASIDKACKEYGNRINKKVPVDYDRTYTRLKTNSYNNVKRVGAALNTKDQNILLRGTRAIFWAGWGIASSMACLGLDIAGNRKAKKRAQRKLLAA
jgi:hypothetical protein